MMYLKTTVRVTRTNFGSWLYVSNVTNGSKKHERLSGAEMIGTAHTPTRCAASEAASKGLTLVYGMGDKDTQAGPGRTAGTLSRLTPPPPGLYGGKGTPTNPSPPSFGLEGVPQHPTTFVPTFVPVKPCPTPHPTCFSCAPSPSQFYIISSAVEYTVLPPPPPTGS